MERALSRLIVIAILVIILIASISVYVLLSIGSGQANTSNTKTPISSISVSIAAGGSTFANPAMQSFIAYFNSRYPNIQVTYSSVGSGAGVNGFLQGIYDIGATDVPPPSSTYQQIIGKYGKILTLPILIGSVVIIYNIPDFKYKLNLTAELIAKMYLGEIRYWDDPEIKALNPSFNFPHKIITAVHRSDGSGTTFVFTLWLHVSSQEWKNSNVGYGYTVQWPVDNLGNGQGGKGSEGVTALVKQTPYSIGYVELQYAIVNNLNSAYIQNPQTGEFVYPSDSSVENALNNADYNRLPSFDQDMYNYAGIFFNIKASNAYPIVSFSWLLLKIQYEDFSKAAGIYIFIKISATEVQKKLPQGYLPIPEALQQRILEAIKLINYKGTPVHESIQE